MKLRGPPGQNAKILKCLFGEFWCWNELLVPRQSIVVLGATKFGGRVPAFWAPEKSNPNGGCQTLGLGLALSLCWLFTDLASSFSQSQQPFSRSGRGSQRGGWRHTWVGSRVFGRCSGVDNRGDQVAKCGARGPAVGWVDACLVVPAGAFRTWFGVWNGQLTEQHRWLGWEQVEVR